jgi:hypothetical protein
METSPAGSDPRHGLGGGTGLFVFGVLAVLLATLLTAAGCAPSLRIIALPPADTPGLPPAGSPEPCDTPDVDDQVLEAAWAYVHARYPAQPWPDTIYLPQEWTVVVASKRHLTHVVLCSHATGFVWEGEVAWHAACTCCRVDVDGIRESFVMVAPPAASSTPRPPGSALSH